MTMETEVSIETTTLQETSLKMIPPLKSFKEALNTIKHDDYLFDTRVDILSLDEDDDA